MARQYARVFVSIWTNADFVALTANAKLLYLALVSQPDITPCGLLTVTTRRWKQYLDGTERSVDMALEELTSERFVVVDDDTAELWVRSFMKHDGRLQNPKLRATISTALDQIRSESLQKQGRAEFDRISPARLPMPSPTALPMALEPDRLSISVQPEPEPYSVYDDSSHDGSDRATTNGTSSSNEVDPSDLIAATVDLAVAGLALKDAARIDFPIPWRKNVRRYIREEKGAWIAAQLAEQRTPLSIAGEICGGETWVRKAQSGNPEGYA